VTGEKLAPVTGEVQLVAHELVLGEHSFPCAPRMPLGTLLKYAAGDLGSLEVTHHLLVKLVRVDDMDPVWDACDELEPEAVMEAISSLLGSYSAPTPTEPGSSSPNGSAGPAELAS
jgi:hypothetical protein